MNKIHWVWKSAFGSLIVIAPFRDRGVSCHVFLRGAPNRMVAQFRLNRALLPAGNDLRGKLSGCGTLAVKPEG